MQITAGNTVSEKEMFLPAHTFEVPQKAIDNKMFRIPLMARQPRKKHKTNSKTLRPTNAVKCIVPHNEDMEPRDRTLQVREITIG